MKHGDISNQVGVTIGFRCEDFLVKFKKSSFADKVLNLILGDANRAEIDHSVKSVMEHLYRGTDMNVDLIILRSCLTSSMREVLDDIPYNRLVVIDKESEIAIRLLTGDLTYYIDSDTYRLSLINSKFAMTLERFYKEVLGRI